jgi:hypothetical protein
MLDHHFAVRNLGIPKSQGGLVLRLSTHSKLTQKFKVAENSTDDLSLSRLAASNIRVREGYHGVPTIAMILAG